MQHLRDQIAELRLGRFLNTVGADGYSRCPIMPFWTRSGRNQPRGRDKVFLLSLPSWLHGLIAPPPGWGMALLDWKAQEIGIAAGLSSDPALIADFQAGDPHMGFAIRAGLAPTGATAETPRRRSQHGQADLARQSIRDVEVRRRGAIRQVTGMGGNHTRRTSSCLSGVYPMAAERGDTSPVR